MAGGHRLVSEIVATPLVIEHTDTLDASPIAYTRDYLTAFEAELDKADSGAALTDAMVALHPDSGMLIAATLGAKVAKVEMSWG